MTTYCNPGDTARVTFPDGSVRDFSNTPIDISVGEDYPICPTYTVNVSYTQVRSDGFVQNGVRLGRRLPVRAYVTGDNSQSYIVDTVCSGGQPTGERFALLTAGSPGVIRSLVITGITNSLTAAPVTPTYRITVTSDGTNLFTGSFNNPNYSVECITSCPPNTLDCGDCCLDCEDIFYKLCNINQLFIG
ncbi:MAG: hypothetical protein RLZZ507_4375 [Cyanobacteriota bacterium]